MSNNTNTTNNTNSINKKLRFGYARKNKSQLSSFIDNKNYGLYGIVYNDILEYFDNYGLPECNDSRLKYILNQKKVKLRKILKIFINLVIII